MPDIILGVDHGVTGAISGFVDGELLYLHNLPNIEIVKPRKGAAVRDLFGGGSKVKTSHVLDIEKCVALIRGIVRDRKAIMVGEHVHTFPGQGMVTTGKLLASAAALQGIAGTLGIDYTQVEPELWKRQTGTGKGKPAACLHATRLFPAWEDQFKRRSIDHHKADAALIGLWAVNHLA